jgi:transcriptional regulator GlxA family with amidase domain
METGMSFVAYINKVRLEHAARMLVETDLPCNRIGYDCGFITFATKREWQYREALRP